MSLFSRFFGSRQSLSRRIFDEVFRLCQNGDLPNELQFSVCLLLPIKYFGAYEGGKKLVKDLEAYTSDVGLFELASFISARINYLLGDDETMRSKLQVNNCRVIMQLSAHLFISNQELEKTFMNRMEFYRISFAELSVPHADLFHVMVMSVADGGPGRLPSREVVIGRHLKPHTALPFTLMGVIVEWQATWLDDKWLEFLHNARSHLRED